jgi:hypothetical protein
VQTKEFAFSYNSAMRLMMTPMLAGPRHSTIRVGDDGVVVRMGLAGWMFTADVPLSSIVAATQVSGPVWGWGAHGWRGSWLVNGSGVGLVRLTIEPTARGRCLGYPLRVRQLTLSLADPEAFISAVSPN